MLGRSNHYYRYEQSVLKSLFKWTWVQSCLQRLKAWSFRYSVNIPHFQIQAYADTCICIKEMDLEMSEIKRLMTIVHI